MVMIAMERLRLIAMEILIIAMETTIIATMVKNTFKLVGGVQSICLSRVTTIYISSELLILFRYIDVVSHIR